MIINFIIIKFIKNAKQFYLMVLINHYMEKAFKALLIQILEKMKKFNFIKDF